MYDNKVLDYYIKHPEEIEWSKKWLSIHLDCTNEGRKMCKGHCCYGHVDKTKKNRIQVEYYNEEWERIPNNIKTQIKPFLTEEGTVKVNNGSCSLIDFCLRNPKYKPRECKLSPLTFNSKKKLIMSNGSCLHCPNFKKGPEVWISMKDNLIELFGKEFYDRLKVDMNKYRTVDGWL